MRETFVDANFPRTADKRTYHVGVRPGEVANRLITVGHPSRARAIGLLLDSQPKPFEIESDRGFLVITGRYKGVPVSCISIGMGFPNMDFLVREVRESVEGDLLIVRLGSSGGLMDVPVGSLVVPRASVAITRNYDFDFSRRDSPAEVSPYHISKPAYPDLDLHQAIYKSLNAHKPLEFSARIIGDTLNASADSFYSSQGRITAFPDCNAGLLERMIDEVEGLATLEMETFHLLHLASLWCPRPDIEARAHLHPSLALPPSHDPAHLSSSPANPQEKSAHTPHPTPQSSKIRAAAVHMVFASRTSQEMITPEEVDKLEAWSGAAILQALVDYEVAPERLHKDTDAVWKR